MNRIFTFLLLLFGLSGPTIRAQCTLLSGGCNTSADTVCGLFVNNVLLWNDPFWLDPVLELHDLAEAAADLQLSLVDTCAGASVHIRYVLLLDLDADGVKETAVDSDNPPPAGAVWFGNAQNPGYTGGMLQSFDGRPVPPDQKYLFALDTTLGPGDSITAAVRWNNAQTPGSFFLPGLPLGQHKIRWIVTNGLGDTTVCERNVEVLDCKAPVVFCNQMLSVNLLVTGAVTLWATDFLQYAEDNVTPPTPYYPDYQLAFAIRAAGQGTGFPVDNFGQPQTSISFNCQQTGLQMLELWARDAAGNAGYCETVLIVQDPFNNCSGGSDDYTLACVHDHCTGQKVPGVDYNFETPPGLPPLFLLEDLVNDSTGCLESLGYPIGQSTISLSKNDDPLNGLSTFDLVLMSKHILGIDTLDSPYKIIAADINKSNSVTTFDIVELRKLLLGVYNTFPNNKSWRFVKSDFSFSNPLNPFASAPFAETATVQPGLPVEFTAIKIGDLNCSAIVDFVSPNGILLADRQLSPGESFELPFEVADASDWLGLQFALRYDPEALEVENIVPGVLSMLSSESFAIFPGRVAMSWSNGFPENVAPGQALFSLRMRALKPLKLSEVLSLEEQSLNAEAYTNDLKIQPVRLLFRSDEAAPDAPQVFAVQPNPTREGAFIPLYLPAKASSTLEVFDGTGKRVHLIDDQLDTGLQMLEISENTMLESGVYYWQLSLNEHRFSGRIIRL